MGLYVWIENGQIRTTEFKEYAPDNAVYYENMSFLDADKFYIDQNGQIAIKTDKQILEEEKQKRLQELKSIVANLLSKTDWIYIKCMELGLDPQTVYPDKVQERINLRQKKDQYEQAIMNAKSIEELRAIRFEF